MKLLELTKDFKRMQEETRHKVAVTVPAPLQGESKVPFDAQNLQLKV